MSALSNTGKEGELRARYVQRLEAGEEQLARLQNEEQQHNAEIKRLEDEVARRLEAF
jgi:DNA-binding PadR family transcriptional regulator